MDAGTQRPRRSAADLIAFGTALLRGAGLDTDKATAVAEVLVEGDLLGHDTHGLALLAPYLRELDAGTMAAQGGPRVLSDRPAAVAWDGRRLPGPWLVRQALEVAVPRARDLGLCGVAIGRCHHIASLAAYLRPVAEQGLMVIITSSDPNGRDVAPAGGTQGVYTPDPVAVGFPTGADPVLIDISASITTNGMSARHHREGTRLPGPWLVSPAGEATDDPGVLFATPRGALLPVGGLAYGHKGYGLALLVEALTGGLAGHGRADPPEGWGAGVYVQVIDPSAFGGLGAFERQMGTLAAQCRASAPRPGGPPVRLPGEGGLARRARQLREGVSLYPGILEALEPWATRHGVPLPPPQ